MAEEATPEVVDTTNTVASVDMDVENVESGDITGKPNEKRTREEEESNVDVVLKKHKVEEDKSVEEQRLEELEQPEKKEEERKVSDAVNLGPKSFGSSLDMFHYFYNFLHAWPHHLNINKYEHTMLLELLKKGHAEPDKKIGGGIRAFQVRNHPTFKSRCFFLIREDDSVDDFSFRKCVDHILPLPEEMHLKSEGNKGYGGGGGRHYGGKGGRGRGGRGGGRGGGGRGRWRH